MWEWRGMKEGCGWGEEREGGKHTILPPAQVSNFSFGESHCWSRCNKTVIKTV